MDARTARPKATVTKLAPLPATSRPSSRNSTHPASRPASPTKSFISTSSPLASTSSTITTRPKAKVNSSAIRRTPSTTTDSPVHITRPSSPSKLTPRRDGALSPPSSTVSVGTRSKPVARVKASSSVSSVKSTKSPSPELRARSLTASADILRSDPMADSRKHQGSAASVLHHTSSQSNLQAPPPTNVPPIPPLPSGALRASRVAYSELSGVTSDVEGVENLNEIGSPAPQPLKIRSKVTVVAKNLNDVSNTPSTILVPEFSSPSIPSPTTSTSGASRPVRAHVRAGSVSSTISSPGASAASPPTPNTLAYPITTAVPAANPHRYATPRSSFSGLHSSFSASSSPKYNPPARTDDFRPFAKTSIFPSSPSSSNSNVYGGLNDLSHGRAASSPSVDLTIIPPLPQSPPISAISVSSRSSYSGNLTYDSGTSPESSVISGVGPGLKKKRDSSPHSLRTVLDNLVAYASSRGEDDSPINGSSGPIVKAEKDEETKTRAEAKSNRKIADLEITNRSLLAINASLEKTKDRQAKEIRELKRKLRETRLILPPRAYRAVISSLDPTEVGDDEEDIDSDFSSDDSDDDEFHSADESVNGAGASSGKGKGDATYRRVKLIIENLLETGKKALEKTREDFMDARGGAKVLTAEEVESWRDSGAGSSTIGRLSDSESHLDTLDDEDTSSSSRLTRSHSPTPQPASSNGNVTRTSFRQMNFGPLSSMTLLSSPNPPPILITETP